MNKKLIVAAILSLIGAAPVAWILGLSVYTVVFFPAFIIVLIVNIWGGQRARAVWLGFLLSLMVIPFPSLLTVLFHPSSGELGIVILLILLIVIAAFVLVSTVFLRGQERSHIPDKQLAVLAGIILLLAAIILIAERVWYVETYYRISDELRRYSHSQLNWPYIILSTLSQVVITIGISVLLFFRERFTFFVVAPIFLVYNLLLAFNRIFHFSNAHLSRQEIILYLTTPFQLGTEVIFYIYDVYALLTLAFVVYFLESYTKGKEGYS
jgi:hypothetical protein